MLIHLGMVYPFFWWCWGWWQWQLFGAPPGSSSPPPTAKLWRHRASNAPGAKSHAMVWWPKDIPTIPAIFQYLSPFLPQKKVRKFLGITLMLQKTWYHLMKHDDTAWWLSDAILPNTYWKEHLCVATTCGTCGMLLIKISPLYPHYISLVNPPNQSQFPDILPHLMACKSS